jgi:AcrR family transcriptional regulator
MPRQRFFNLPEASRKQLLAVATHHFAARGFEGASLNEILADAGISKGAYYYYFDDKDDLFATTLEAAIDEMLGRVTMPDVAAVSREDFWPLIERYVHAFVANLDVASDAMLAAAQLSEAQRRSPRFAAVMHKSSALYRGLIEPGQRLGCVRDDLPVDVLVRLLEANDALLDTLLLAEKRPLSKARMDAHVALVFDTIKRLAIAAPFVAEATPPAKRPKTSKKVRRD